jgi:sulfide:quinone oxidoreductase
MSFTSSQPHVVIAGGGIAAVEAALALHDLAGDRIRLTIVAPNREFELRPLSTAEPFSADHVRRHALDALARRVGAELVAEAVTKVDAGARRVTAGNRDVDYDALILALGGRHVPAYAKAITFAGDTGEVDYHGLLQDVDEGYTRAVTFIVPPGITWTLPLYELALMTAREAYAMGMKDIRFELVSPEDAPLGLFGRQAADAMAELLGKAGIAFRGGAYVREHDGAFELVPGGEVLDVHRVVALPTIEGIRIDGVPADEQGFIPVDDRLRVSGLSDVYAAGDGTTFPVKQGGLACQQADAIAELLAAAAGADVEPQPFRPVLRGRLLTGAGAQYLEHMVHGGDGDAPAPELQLWSASRKVDGRYLSPWLEELEAAPAQPAPEDAVAGNVDVEVALDATPPTPGSPRT